MNKVLRKVLGIATVGVGSWFVYVYFKDIIDQFISGEPLIALGIGILLIIVGLSVFKLKGPDF